MKKHHIGFLLLLFSTNILFVWGSSGEFDKLAYVKWVIDGDTFRTEDNDSIRLADINTPEENQTGYWEATNFMISTVKNKVIFLDIDDKYIYDDEGQGTRLVCVVYTEYNQTHYLNVNKALLENNLAVIWEHDNEFNPYKWTLYISKNDIPEFNTEIILPLFLTVTLSMLIIKKKMVRNS